jgi:hypothetical protein
MNLAPILAQLMQAQPDYWFELSVWDGQEPDRPTDKKRFYASKGQTLSPERFAGMTQFGMWLLRPRVVREFRNPSHGGVAKFGAYFDETLAAVARVHEVPELERFWRYGRLLANPEQAHPYQSAIPREYASQSRWFLLTSDANPPPPWKLETPLRVFALALENDRQQRLVYAFSPTESEVLSHIKIPGVAEPVAIRARLGGSFTLITQDSASPIAESRLRRFLPACERRDFRCASEAPLHSLRRSR